MSMAREMAELEANEPSSANLLDDIKDEDRMTPLIETNRQSFGARAMPVSTRASNPTGFHDFNIEVTEPEGDVGNLNDISDIVPQQDKSNVLNDNSFLLTINDAFKYHGNGPDSTPVGKQKCKFP